MALSYIHLTLLRMSAAWWKGENTTVKSNLLCDTGAPPHFSMRRSHTNKVLENKTQCASNNRMRNLNESLCQKNSRSLIGTLWKPPENMSYLSSLSLPATRSYPIFHDPKGQSYCSRINLTRLGPSHRGTRDAKIVQALSRIRDVINSFPVSTPIFCLGKFSWMISRIVST